MILWHVYSPPSARTTVSIADRVCGRRPYLIIVENEAKRSRDGPERTEGTCGVSHSTEQFCCDRRSRLVVRFLLIRGGARFGGLFRTNVWSVFRKDGGAYIVRRNDQRQDPKQPRSRTVWFPTTGD